MGAMKEGGGMERGGVGRRLTGDVAERAPSERFKHCHILAAHLFPQRLCRVAEHQLGDVWAAKDLSNHGPPVPVQGLLLIPSVFGPLSEPDARPRPQRADALPLLGRHGELAERLDANVSAGNIVGLEMENVEQDLGCFEGALDLQPFGIVCQLTTEARRREAQGFG